MPIKAYAERLKDPLNHKTLTKRKRLALGIPSVTFPRSLKFGGRDWTRELVRIRDHHTCQKCGKRWKKGRRRFDVHHMEEKYDGKSKMKGITKYDRSNLDKLITLCHKCHFSLDITRKRMGLKVFHRVLNKTT